MECRSYICKICVAEWAKSKLMMDRLSNEVTIPCPNNGWNHSLTSEDIIKYIGIKAFEEINEQFTDMYCTNAEDIRKCPNNNCDYAGVIELKSCNEPLECDLWENTWREYEQMTIYQKLIRGLSKTFSLESETFSYINKVLVGVSCPKCGLTISKGGGCDHMTWKRCKHEFCWICLGHYEEASHTDETFWPLRFFIRFVFLIIALISLEYKIIKTCPLIASLINFIVNILSYPFYYVLFPNGLLFSFVLIGPFSGLPAAFFSLRNTIGYILGIIFAILIFLGGPMSYVYMWYWIITYDKYFFIAKWIFFEIILAFFFIAIKINKETLQKCLMGFVHFVSNFWKSLLWILWKPILIFINLFNFNKERVYK